MTAEHRYCLWYLTDVAREHYVVVVAGRLMFRPVDEVHETGHANDGDLVRFTTRAEAQAYALAAKHLDCHLRVKRVRHVQAKAPRAEPPGFRLQPPAGFREGHNGDLACPHRNVSCCEPCAKAHPEIVEVACAHYWIADPAERIALSVQQRGTT